MEKTIEKKLNDFIKAGDVASFLTALGDVARSGNMAKLARDVGMTREGVYHALSEKGNPTFSALVKITKALGITINFSNM